MKKGYSLLEVVVYLALFALVGVAAVEATFSVYKAYGRTRVERKLNLNGDIAMETLIRSIRDATSTDMSVSMFGASPGTLSVGGKTFSVNGASNDLQINDDSGTANITSDASVINFVLYRDATTTSEVIKVELTLSAGQGSFTKTKNFYGSAVLRGKY